MKKLGIMGGSFNPIHQGHITIAECAYRQYQLDEVAFIPNSCPPYKDASHMVAAKERMNMIKLAIADVPYFSINDIEIKRGGLSYTYRTILDLKQLEPQTEIYFLMGGDSLRDFRTWRESQIIAQNCHILAAMRGDIDNEDIKSLAKELSKEYQGDFSMVTIPRMDISSTHIRENVKCGESITGMTPAAVITYIEENGLYKE